MELVLLGLDASLRLLHQLLFLHPDDLRLLHGAGLLRLLLHLLLALLLHLHEASTLLLSLLLLTDVEVSVALHLGVGIVNHVLRVGRPSHVLLDSRLEVGVVLRFLLRIIRRTLWSVVRCVRLRIATLRIAVVLRVALLRISLLRVAVGVLLLLPLRVAHGRREQSTVLHTLP